MLALALAAVRALVARALAAQEEAAQVVVARALAAQVVDARALAARVLEARALAAWALSHDSHCEQQTEVTLRIGWATDKADKAGF